MTFVISHHELVGFFRTNFSKWVTIQLSGVTNTGVFICDNNKCHVIKPFFDKWKNKTLQTILSVFEMLFWFRGVTINEQIKCDSVPNINLDVTLNQGQALIVFTTLSQTMKRSHFNPQAFTFLSVLMLEMNITYLCYCTIPQLIRVWHRKANRSR